MADLKQTASAADMAVSYSCSVGRPPARIMYVHISVSLAAEFPPERNYHAAAVGGTTGGKQLGMTDSGRRERPEGQMCALGALRNVANQFGRNFDI